MGKGKPMKISRKGLLAAIAVSAVLLLSFRAASPQQSSPQLSSEQIAQIVASPDRSEADRTNDLRRKPEQMLAFIGIRPGIVALDLSAAGGYTTELLARAIGPSGTVYGQSHAIPAGRRHPLPRPRATATRPPHPVRHRRRRRRRDVHPPRPWLNVTISSGATASRPHQSSPFPDRSPIPFRPNRRQSVSIS
jgi:hypothetical protein